MLLKLKLSHELFLPKETQVTKLQQKCKRPVLFETAFENVLYDSLYDSMPYMVPYMIRYGQDVQYLGTYLL